MPYQQQSVSQRKTELFVCSYVCTSCKKMVSSQQLLTGTVSLVNGLPFCCHLYMVSKKFDEKGILYFMCSNCDVHTQCYGYYSIVGSFVSIFSCQDFFTCPGCKVKALVPLTNYIYHHYVCLNCKYDQGFISAFSKNNTNCKRCLSSNLVSLFLYDYLYKDKFNFLFDNCML